jgi:membrane protein DedA with SNARE-associated domain
MEALLAFLSSHAYAKLAAVLLLCGLGLPVPEDISLVSAGYLAYLGIVDVHGAFLVCMAAVMGGDLAAFSIGRYFGAPLMQTAFGRRILSPGRQARLRAYFSKHGNKVVFIARFLPGLRFSTFLSAGMMRVRPHVFLAYDLLAALISVPVIVYVAWYFGEHIDTVVKWIRRSEYAIVALIALGIAYAVLRVYRRRRTSATDALAAKLPPAGAELSMGVVANPRTRPLKEALGDSARGREVSTTGGVSAFGVETGQG